MSTSSSISCCTDPQVRGRDMVGWTGTAAPWHPSLLGDTGEDVPLRVTQGRTCPQHQLHVHPAKHLLQELLPARAARLSLHWCSRWYLGTRQGKQPAKSFNFYDIKTANRVKGIGRTGPKINNTLQTVNKGPLECKTVTCTVTNTIIF